MIVAALRSRAAPALERASDWLAGRSERERLLLIVMATLGLAAAGWYGVIQPLLIARQTSIARIELYEGLQARLRASPAGAVTTPGQAPVSGPLDEAVRQAAAQALAVDVKGDADTVTVTVAAARFDAAMSFVRALESGGAMIGQLRMEAGPGPGQVNLTFTATRP